MTKELELRPVRRANSGEALAGQRRREALRRLMHNYRLTPNELARLAGYKEANLLFNLLSGRANSLSVGTIERILIVLPNVSFEELVGWASSGQRTRPAPSTIKPGKPRDRRKIRNVIDQFDD